MTSFQILNGLLNSLLNRITIVWHHSIDNCYILWLDFTSGFQAPLYVVLRIRVRPDRFRAIVHFSFFQNLCRGMHVGWPLPVCCGRRQGQG